MRANRQLLGTFCDVTRLAIRRHAISYKEARQFRSAGLALLIGWAGTWAS